MSWDGFFVFNASNTLDCKSLTVDIAAMGAKALMLELRRYCCLNLTPGQPRGQYRQRDVQIDHGVNSAAEKVNVLHPRFPQKVTLNIAFLGGFGVPELPKNLAFMRVGGVFRADYLIFLNIAIENLTNGLIARFFRLKAIQKYISIDLCYYRMQPHHINTSERGPPC